MAGGNVTAAALCKKSNRVSRVLAYALLEWILIALLLANGVFSYLISRFAAFFGLAPPCALCSRLGIDALFEPPHRQGAGGEPLRRVLCDAHAAEVSRLGYCRAHRRLADAGDMCEDCASSAAAAAGKALLSWMRRSELGERDLACACCGVALESGFFSPPYLLPTPAAARGSDSVYTRDADVANLNGDVVFVSKEGPVIELFDEKPLLDDDSIGGVMAAQCAEIVGNAEQLVPLESIGEGKEATDDAIVKRRDVAMQKTANTDDENFVVASDDEKEDNMIDRLIEEEIVALVVSICMGGLNNEIDAGETAEGLADQLVLEDDSGVKDKDQEISNGDEVSEAEQVEQGVVIQKLLSMPTDSRVHEFSVDNLDGNAEESVCQPELNNEWNCLPMKAVVHGAHVFQTSNNNTENKLIQQAGLIQESNSVVMYSREPADEEFQEEKNSQIELKERLDSVAIDSCEEVHVISNECSGKKQVLEYTIDSFDADAITGNVDPTGAALPSLQQISYGPSTSLDKLSLDLNGIESDIVHDTPTHIEGIGELLELPESVAMVSYTKCTDSSFTTVSTDLESTGPVSVDQLKSALAAAHTSLNNLYSELENERSAAAIATDETMAMINRLQEQKAAMQMEAMQYQRLMEEQSEYDQEALQRMNELVVKRDKEKQELQRELELFRHKVHLYEAKERRKMSRHKTDDQNGSSSASSSAEDSDDLSQSFYEGDESSHGLSGSNGSIPTDVVLQVTARHLGTLDGSLADFEEERLSILEQLKMLEERLFDLEYEESDNVKMDKHFSEENHLSGDSNGFSDDDCSFRLLDARKGVSCRGKKLLPLFDDTTVENVNGLLTMQDPEVDQSSEVMLQPAKEKDKLAIANEIDQVHERLHALESDREFIKQCVRSLKKGGKGFDLLQEILQHLRDLRRIEHRARNCGELSPHYLHPYTD